VCVDVAEGAALPAILHSSFFLVNGISSSAIAATSFAIAVMWYMSTVVHDAVQKVYMLNVVALTIFSCQYRYARN
jgi:hypothetical protein